MAEPKLDPTMMNRLAFIRLLYLQAIELANRSEPLSAASVLTFHDIVELFLILAAEHRSAPALSRDGAFLDYWRILRPQRGYKGVELSGHLAMGRLHGVRNSFKHAGRLPTRAEVEDARSNVRRFLEDNTPKVFGIEFGDIDLADVIPHLGAREKLKAAAVAEAAGNRSDAMALLASAFASVFYPRSRSGADGLRFSFGRTVDPWTEDEAELAEDEDEPVEDPDELGENRSKLSEQFAKVTEAVTQMQKAMRVMALGIDYGRFLRFEALTDMDLFYAPTQEEYDFCVQFVIDAAFRIAEIEANAVPPSWWDW